MNIWHRITMLITCFVFLPAVALADNSGWYVAADAGQSNFIGTGDVPSLVSVHFTSASSGYRLSSGYQFNTYLGIEVGYVDLGQVTGSTYFVTPLNGPGPLCVPCQFSYDINATLKGRGWTFELTGTYPITNNWFVFARAGVIDARSEVDAYYTPISPWEATEQPFDLNHVSTDWDSTYGLGVDWSFAEHWAARLSWDRYSSLGQSGITGTYSVNLASLGIMYRF